MVAELLRKYIWLVQTLLRAGERGLCFEEIQRRWEERFGDDYPRRTFNNHRACVEELFNIEIECNRADNSYFIRYPDDVTDENASSAWLINTFTVNNILTLGKERLSGRVAVEDIPSGRMYLTAIMDAMLDGNVLRAGYKKYAADEESRYTLHPYALKEVAKRWYLVAYCEERQGLRVYGLDRLTSVESSGEHFTMPAGFDVDELFADSYGVYLTDNEPCEIRFRATEREAQYIRDLPLHHSQKEVETVEGGVIFSIFVRPNRSLMMEFLHLGSEIEVLSPAGVRSELAGMLREAAALYEGKGGR